MTEGSDEESPWSPAMYPISLDLEVGNWNLMANLRSVI